MQLCLISSGNVSAFQWGNHSLKLRICCSLRKGHNLVPTCPIISVLAWLCNLCYLPVSCRRVNMWPLCHISPKDVSTILALEQFILMTGEHLHHFFKQLSMSSGFQNSYLPPHNHDGSKWPRSTVNQMSKTPPLPWEAWWTPACINCDISALLLVCKPAFPIALLYLLKPLLSSGSILGGVEF